MYSIATGVDSQKAELPIDIIVIGASVAGLASAYSLRQAGHNVLVLEADNTLETVLSSFSYFYSSV